MELHPDREISTALLGSMTKYFPMRGMKDPTSRQEIINGQIKIDTILNAMSSGSGNGSGNGVEVGGVSGGGGVLTMSCIMGAKSQSGMPPEIVARFKNTSNNPALLDTVGLWLIMVQVPSLPSLGQWSSTILKALWSVCHPSDARNVLEGPLVGPLCPVQ